MSVTKVESITEPIPVWLPTECIDVDIKFTTIFQSGHGVKAVKEISLFLKRWINNSKEKPKDICDKNKDLIEYHKVQEMPLERN